MKIARRSFLHAAVALSGAPILLPFVARAQGGAEGRFETGAGALSVHPVAHASFVMETPAGVIYCDPVGDVSQYAGLPAPDLILVTHEHGDHYNAGTLTALSKDKATLITNPAVGGMLPEGLRAGASQMANGETMSWEGVSIEAIPAYNLTEERKKFHPKGRDNGYVLNFGDFRVYISGDTENTPEMKALENIDLAFLCMNLPFTMDIAQAADAVNAFKPKFIYPYHYRGRDGGTQDPAEFASLVEGVSEVKLANWYASS